MLKACINIECFHTFSCIGVSTSCNEAYNTVMSPNVTGTGVNTITTNNGVTNTARTESCAIITSSNEAYVLAYDVTGRNLQLDSITTEDNMAYQKTTIASR